MDQIANPMQQFYKSFEPQMNLPYLAITEKLDIYH